MIPPEIVLGALGVAMACVGFEMHAALQVHYRKGCHECAAARDQSAKDDVARRHDYDHKGGGFRPGDPDRYHCADESCKRNPRQLD